MKYIRYSRYTGEPADEVDLQELIKRLGDFLLQSGFESQSMGISEMDPEHAMEALREAILRALQEGDLLPEDLLDGLTQANADATTQQQLRDLVDRLIQRMMDEGYLQGQPPQVTPPPEKMPRGSAGAGRDAQNTRFEITDKTIDFLGLPHPERPCWDRWARAALAVTTRASWRRASNPGARRGPTNSATRSIWTSARRFSMPCGAKA